MLPKIKPMISFLIAQWTQNWSMNFLSIKIFELQCHVFPLQPPCSGHHELGSCHLPAEITFSRPLIIPWSCRLPVSFPLSPEKCQGPPFSTKNPIIFISAGTSLCPGCGSDFAHRKVYSTSCLVTTSALLFEIALGTGEIYFALLLLLDFINKPAKRKPK